MIYVILAGLFEVVGVFLLKKLVETQGVQKAIFFILLMFSFGISLLLLRQGMLEISASVAYGVWTGIGSIGSVVVGIFLFKESCNALKLFFLSLIIASVIGLKVVS